MKPLRRFIDRIRPHFDEGGKLQKLYPLYEAIDTFLYTPDHVTTGLTHVRDSLEMKRLIRQEMLDPELLTGMLLSAHLIIFWLSQDSNVTPPVCLAAFAAAGIAGTRPMATGLTSWNVAKGLYLIPLLFAYSPLISGTWPERLEVFGWSCLGLYALAGLLHWHLEIRLTALTAALLLLSATLLMWMPFGIFFHLIGAGILIGVILWQRRIKSANLETTA